MKRNELIGAADLGGTHIVSALIDTSGRVEEATRKRIDLHPDMGRSELLSRMAACLQDTGSGATLVPVSWGIAAPGPFDYERGVCLIKGVAKFESLYGVDLRVEFSRRLGIAQEAFHFLNDASAFVLGEAWVGTAAGHDRVIGITLGTGLGSGFLDAGCIVEDHPAVPAHGRLDLVEYKGVAAEERFSRRGILRSYGAPPSIDVVDVVERARRGENRAMRTMDNFAAGLADFLAPWVFSFDATCLVVGGGIARAWDLLQPALLSLEKDAPAPLKVVPTGLGDDAPLIGAAVWAARQRSA